MQRQEGGTHENWKGRHFLHTHTHKHTEEGVEGDGEGHPLQDLKGVVGDGHQIEGEAIRDLVRSLSWFAEALKLDVAEEVDEHAHLCHR